MEKIRALIIDDDRDTANLFSMVLKLVGFECDVCYSAKSALVYLAQDEPDIVLLDMRLGLEISGTDILYQIRSNPRFDKMRVVVITAYPHMAAPVHDLADLVMLKPVEVENLQTLATRLTQIRPKSYMFRDPVTNLYTARFFLTRLEHAFERMKRRPDFLFATMVIDFEVEVKDGEQLYYADREQLLKLIAGQLTRNFRPTDTFGRIDGERISALYEDLKQPQDLQVIVERLRGELLGEYEINQRQLQVSPYIGAVLNDERFEQAENILQAAIQALDKACEARAEGYLLAHPFGS
ncbi:MAG: diguanylate cyclase domain-containing protein [Anaerolineales bacterium]